MIGAALGNEGVQEHGNQQFADPIRVAMGSLFSA